MKHPLSIRKLSAWLQKQPDDGIVGRSGIVYDCPCQRCIVDTNPALVGKLVEVSRTRTYVEKDDWQGIPNPTWLVRLTRMIDQSIAYGGPVTAKTVRSFLWRATHP